MKALILLIPVVVFIIGITIITFKFLIYSRKNLSSVDKMLHARITAYLVRSRLPRMQGPYQVKHSYLNGKHAVAITDRDDNVLMVSVADPSEAQMLSRRGVISEAEPRDIYQDKQFSAGCALVHYCRGLLANRI